MPAISVVICTHNGEQLLPEALTALAHQEGGSEDTFEVLVVDNASIDRTREVARDSWRGVTRAPLRVVSEPRLGLNWARVRGLSEATGNIVAFVDDDNRVAADWVRRVREALASHPETGACGGYNEPAFDGPPPPWFTGYQSAFAVGPQAERAGDVTARGYLWGAGLAIRRKAWENLQAGGFAPCATDRRGASLASGGDTELCLALCLAGWRLWYDPAIRLTHMITAPRLTWSYLRRLCREGGRSSVLLDAYAFAAKGRPGSRRQRLARRWWWRACSVARELARRPALLVRAFAQPFDGNLDVPRLEWNLGRLDALVRARRDYDRMAELLSTRSWQGRPFPH